MQNSNTIETQNNKVLVVGGGLGGIRTALDLAEAEKDVVLVDKDFTVGGLMTQLDRTFPTNNCDHRRHGKHGLYPYCATRASYYSQHHQPANFLRS